MIGPRSNRLHPISLTGTDGATRADTGLEEAQAVSGIEQILGDDLRYLQRLIRGKTCNKDV